VCGEGGVVWLMVQSGAVWSVADGVEWCVWSVVDGVEVWLMV
jgi:hypothetical protein